MRSHDHGSRAGSYVRQLQGYRAFIPAPLPPQPPLVWNGQMQGLLSQADLALGRLTGSIEILPNSDLFTFMYVRKEAVLSSQIEGTQSSLSDLLSAEARMFDPHQSRDVDEVINYVRALNSGLAALDRLPISVRLIRAVHGELLAEADGGAHLTPGELRTSQNWIGPTGCLLNEAAFVPPPPHEVADHLGRLETFLHADDDLPALIRIGLAHSQFETIHPFLDGNGRVGRLLITLCLCEKKILPKPVLYLSYYFKKFRQQYYDTLQAVRDHGDYEGWISFFLNAVIAVSAEASRTAQQILRLREDHRSLVAEQFGQAAGTGYRTLDHLYSHPIVSVNDVLSITGTTYPAANNLVERMVRCGILEELTGQARNRRFRYSPYVSIFTED